MSGLELSDRHPVSPKDTQTANDAIEQRLGIRPLPETGDTIVEKAQAGPYELLLVDGQALIVLTGPDTNEPLPTLRALTKDPPETRSVTVDMGAVPHLRNGADVMSPGITDADATIEPDDLVWVKDETHGAPLGLGYATIPGDEMVSADSGKAIKIWHHVGDELWNLGT